MYINKIKIKNFRNYSEEEIIFNKNKNILYGNNAQGKTNIIEAVYLAGFGKSFRTNKDKELIKKGESFAEVHVEYQKEDREGNIDIIISDKKMIKANKVEIKRLSELLGKINIVIFTPDDINILKNGPSERRKFLNMMIGQLKQTYLNSLAVYNKTLEQRNNYLKQDRVDINMLKIWDEQLAQYGEVIYNYRKKYVDKIREKIPQIHSDITNEKITIEYESDLYNKEDYLKKLSRNHKNDIKKGYTGSGIHRDDLIIYINDEQVNIYGSQGQNRTAVLSLKLAELEIIKEEIGEYPILLLDDFMSELDETRIEKLLENIADIQVIISCTNNIELQNSKSFNIEKGKVLDK